MISMVVLYKRIPFLNQPLLETFARRAWGIEFDSRDRAMSYVVGQSPFFLLRTDTRTYAVNHVDGTYFESADELTEQTTELRAKHVIQSHTAWVSIDLLGPCDASVDVDAEYLLMGKLLNLLINEETLAIVFPSLMRLIPWDAAMEPSLTGDNLLANLGPPQPPVLNIADDDPQMLAAVRQARLTWHQFVTAFENNALRKQSPSEQEQFSIKAPVSVDGVTEFIWISVTAIENQIIYGLLANHPVALNGLAKGDRVRVPVDHLNDWIYSDSGLQFGGFTVEILYNLANQRIHQF